jgi:cell division protein FtsN
MIAQRHTLTLYGFLAGLVTGLAAAAIAAVYLTNAPLPFVNKVQPSTENITPDATDPNRPLFSAHIPDAPAGPTANPHTEDAGVANAAAPAPPPIASAPAPRTPAAGEAPALAPPPASNPSKPAESSAAATVGDANGRLMLQVGAYKSPQDADAARARLALLGLDAKVTEVTADNVTLYRVRLGPYGQLDDLNGIRRTLSENGMEPQLVHAR